MALPAPASSFPQNPPGTKIQTEIESHSSSDYHHHASAASTPTAAAGSSSSYPHYDVYHVFINHRGPDVKKTFASHLYHRLLSHGLRPFLDLDEWQMGANIMGQIRRVIASASVHVTIFSRRYAESSWCLDELLLILNSGDPIIPVFYHVEPADVRWTKGAFAESLRNLENKKTDEGKPRYDSTTVKNWRKALATVADISGFVLDKDNGDEGDLLDRVVERVLKLVKRPLLDVAKYPTGLHEKIKDFESTVLLQEHSGKPQVVGIVGLGGIGKTTLAKEFFNRNRSMYSRSFFLFDIRDNARQSLSSLQRILLKGLTGSDYQIDDVVEGIVILKRLSFTNVLVILDDVDHVSQVEAFSPVLQSNSLIVITSRDKSVLLSSGVEESAIYKLCGLNRTHSQELFCSFAFSQPYPPPGFEDLVERFIQQCDGIPLSLKVLGGLLCGNTDKSDWLQQLNMLQQVSPDEIQVQLKRSYDTLSREEQEMFLDTACFFIGKKGDMAIRIWEASGWNGRRGFQNLIDKCLVEVGSFNEIHMHKHLEDMGRQIAKYQEKRRLLWSNIKIIDDLLQQLPVETDVRGIRTLSDDNRLSDDDSSEVPWYKRWSYEVFGSYGMKPRNRLHSTRYRGIGIKKLELLDTEGAHLENILRRVWSPNLIWLCWYKCPYSFLPPWISMKNLRVLEVRGNKLQVLWHTEHQVPLQLRELDIVSPLSKLPKSIGYLKHLELFVLKESNLKTLPDEFCYLRSLKRCELTNSLKLTSLPYSFGDLLNLEHMDLSYSSHLHVLPDSFGHLIRLKYLNLSNCCNLSISSRTFKHISTLECIDLSYCTKIEELPLQVAHQRSLQKLYLKGTNLKELPSVIGQLSNLEVLDITGCRELEELPSIETLVSLEELQASYCVKLKTIQGLSQLTKLRTLNVSECSELEALPDVQHLRSLEYLNATARPKLQLRELWSSSSVEVVERSHQRLQALEIGKAEECNESIM